MMAGETLSFKDALDIYRKAKGGAVEVDVLDPQEALQAEKQYLKKVLDGDTAVFFQAFKMHLIGEPERGNDGCDMSKGAKSYDYKLEPLPTTLQKLYKDNKLK